MGLKARVALYAGDYELAATCAGQVIKDGGYDINPTYADLDSPIPAKVLPK